MKKLFLILFAFLFLEAFAKTQNNEINPIDDYSDDDVAVMLISQTLNSEGIRASDGHDLRYQDGERYCSDITTGGHGQGYASCSINEKGYFNSQAERTSPIERQYNRRSSDNYMYVRFAQDQSQAIRDDNQNAEIKNRKDADPYNYQRAHNFSTNILQHRLYNYATVGRSRHLENHNFKTQSRLKTQNQLPKHQAET